MKRFVSGIERYSLVWLIFAVFNFGMFTALWVNTPPHIVLTAALTVVFASLWVFSAIKEPGL